MASVVNDLDKLAQYIVNYEVGNEVIDDDLMELDPLDYFPKAGAKDENSLLPSPTVKKPAEKPKKGILDKEQPTELPLPGRIKAPHLPVEGIKAKPLPLPGDDRAEETSQKKAGLNMLYGQIFGKAAQGMPKAPTKIEAPKNTNQPFPGVGGPITPTTPPQAQPVTPPQPPQAQPVPSGQVKQAGLNHLYNEIFGKASATQAEAKPVIPGQLKPITPTTPPKAKPFKPGQMKQAGIEMLHNAIHGNS